MNIETAKELVGFIEKFENERPLYELSEQTTVAPYLYNEAISKFINFCIREELFDADCYDISDDFTSNRNKNKWFENLDEDCIKSGIMKTCTIGNATAKFVNLRELITLYAEMLRRDPYRFYIFKNN